MESSLNDLEELLVRASLSLSDLIGYFHLRSDEQMNAIVAKQKVLEAMNCVRKIEAQKNFDV